MWSRLTLIFAICLSNSVSLVSSNPPGKLIFCVAEGPHNSKTVRRTCSKFAEDRTLVQCLIVNDRINCLRRLIFGDADFAIFEPEDLVAYSSAYPESHILITHELRLNVAANHSDAASFEMVVLVSKTMGNTFDLAGKKFCHPGLDSPSSDWTRIFSNYLQSWIIPKKCEPDVTLLENDILSWSEHFEAACIAGPWSFDAKVDSQLKAHYRNLCALCDNPNGCYSGDKYHGPEGSLLCLTDNVGNIAWAKLKDVVRHFQALGISNSSYNYLCPDGLMRPMTSGRPCTWISKPWPVIAAQSKAAETVSQLIDFVSQRKFPWQTELLELMEAYHVSLVATDVLKTPEDFLRQFSGFASANSRWSCRPSRSVKWCIASNLEGRKCQWIRDTAAAYGIEPTIACHQHPSRENCMDAVKREACDLFIIRPEEIVRAREANLTSLLEVMPKKTEDLYKTYILVKSNSALFKLSDLAGTRACFPSRHSIEWDVFIAVMQNQTRDPAWNCPKMMDAFFKKIILSDDVEGSKTVDRIASTYDCLASGLGDVAFVSMGEEQYRKSQENVRGICVNSSDSRPCFLTWTSLGSVMINENTTAVRRQEIQTMMMQLNAWFGSKFIKQSLALSLYGPYDADEGVIFHGKAQNLQESIDYIRLPRNYKDILEQLDSSTSLCNDARQQSVVNIFVLASVMFCTNYLN